MKRLTLCLMLVLVASGVAQTVSSPAMVNGGETIPQSARAAGTITGTTTASYTTVNSTGWGLATVTLNGTYAGITVNFEFTDDGTNWFSNTCTRSDLPIQEISEAVASNVTRSWDCGISGTSQFRVRPSLYGSGTANVGITLSAVQLDPGETMTSVLVDGAGNVMTSTGNALDVNAKPTTASGSAISMKSLATLTASASVKASAGNVYGIAFSNGAASVCWVQCVNSATAGTLGTADILDVPMGSTATGSVTLPFPVQFSTGIACGISTTPGGASACGTAGNVTIFYK